VSVFTNNLTIGIQPGKERAIADRILKRDAAFRREDLFLFGERDADRSLSAYLQPNYWLYYPIDQNNPFDSPEPLCRRDWFGVITNSLVARFSKPVTLNSYSLFPTKVRPGDPVIFTGELTKGGELSPEPYLQIGVDPLRAEKNTGAHTSVDNPQRYSEAYRLQYNCIYRKLNGELHVPDDAPAGPLPYNVLVVDNSGNWRTIGSVHVDVDPRAPTQHSRPRMELPQPTAAALRAQLGAVPVVSEGRNYVIFDLAAWGKDVTGLIIPDANRNVH
jgi:hypothetical protein